MFPSTKLDLKFGRSPISSKTLALLIGFGVPGVLAIYYILRRKNDDYLDADDDWNSQGRLGRMRMIKLEVKVPNECVKHIIGPQGSVIKEIQAKTNTRINFKEKPSSNASEAGESIIIVRGSTTSAQLAELEIKRLVLDTPICLTQEYLVPEYACGRIIGRGGASIREISVLSNCKVTLDRKNSSRDLDVQREDLQLIGADTFDVKETASKNTKLVTFVGSIEQIELAKELILSRIKEENELKSRKNGQMLNNSKLEASVIKANERKTKMNQMLNYNYRVDVAPAPPPPVVPIQQQEQQTSHSSTPSLPQTPSQPEVTKTLNKSNSASNSSICSSDSSPASPKIPLPSPQPQSQSNSKTTTIFQLSRIDLQTELDEENRVEVSVSAYSGTLSFWVQLLTNADTLTKFNNEMAEFYNSNVSSFYDFFNKDELNSGDMIAVKISGHEWIRAEVRSLQVKLDGQTRPELVDVYYVDAGVSDYVKFRNIRRLATQFYELAIQAVECNLCDIVPNGEDWPEEALAFFESFVFDKSSYMLEFVAESKNPLVRLFEKSTNTSVSDVMVEKGFAKRKMSTIDIPDEKSELQEKLNDKMTTTSTNEEDSLSSDEFNLSN